MPVYYLATQYYVYAMMLHILVADSGQFLDMVQYLVQSWYQ